MRYAAFLRGINVGGNNMIKMERLREIVANLGFGNVKTYVNSGNVIFDAKKTSEKNLAAKIHDVIYGELGLDIPVMVRSIDEIREIIAANPYEGKFESHKYMHIFILDDELTEAQSELVMATQSEAEFISINGRSIYYMLRIGVHESALGKGFIDKKLKISTTARNWRTMNEIVEM